MLKKKCKIIASLTSFPFRIKTIHMVLDRIFSQTLLADEVHLYLSKVQFPLLEKDLTQELLSFCNKGLQIKWVDEDIRPHKKYYYVMKENPNDIVITLDDDLIYDFDMFEKLYRSYLEFPYAVSTMRVHLMTFDENNNINPYKLWEKEYSNLIGQPSMFLFSTSGAGTLYPPHCMHSELFNMQSIVDLCINADDLWLKVMQVMNNTPTVLVQPCKKLVYIKGSQEIALHKLNVSGGENDIQLKAILHKYNKFLDSWFTLLTKMIKPLKFNNYKQVGEEKLMECNYIKVSVILPVFNVEKYLKEALDSIINQTLKEIEIICVDDGSTDNSLDILKKYAQKDDRFIILEQENQGAGVARNTGLDKACGEYLSFLDPDDFFELTMLEETYNKAVKSDVDIIVFNANSYNDVTHEFKNSYFNLETKSDLINPHDIQDRVFNTFGHPAWNKLFKKSFIDCKGIRFLPLFRTNDKYFTCISLVSADKIFVYDKALMYYRQGMQTNSQATNHRYPLNFYTSELALYDKLNNLQIYESFKLSFFNSMLSSAVYSLNSQKTYEGFKTVYEHLVANLDKDFNILQNEDLFNKYNENIQNFKLMLEQSVDEYLQLKEKYFMDLDDTSLKISVIIPVYNVEKYLHECLDSVLNQTLQSIEIICINDGSTDSSIDILREYAKKDDRFIIINQQNQGSSAARNKGIELAKGKYIYFLDSDCMIVPYALQRMYEVSVTNNLDVLYFDAKSIFESFELKIKHHHYTTAYESNFSTSLVLSGAKMFVKMCLNNSYRVSSCLQFIRTDFLKSENITFPEGIIHEDNVFMFKAILVADRVRHIKEELFLRRVRAGSTMTMEKTFKNFYGYLICYIEMLSYSNQFEYTEDVETAVVVTLDSILINVVECYNALKQSEKDKLDNLTRIERYYFDMISAYKNIGSVINTNELDKYKNQLNSHKDEACLIRSSASYKIGRFMTIIPRAVRCYKENGLKYTYNRLLFRLKIKK